MQPTVDGPSYANLVLEDQSNNVLGDEVLTDTPEPATWMLTVFSLGLLFAFVPQMRRRKLQTAPVSESGQRPSVSLAGRCSRRSPACCSIAAVAAGQTTQGLISGRLLDRGPPVRWPARISSASRNRPTPRPMRPRITRDTTHSHFCRPARIRSRDCPRVSVAEAEQLELAVAGRLEITFLVRPLKRRLGSGNVPERTASRIANRGHVLRSRRGRQLFRQFRRDDGSGRVRSNPRFPTSSIQSKSTIFPWPAATFTRCCSRFPR